VLPGSPDWVREGEVFATRNAGRTGGSADWVRAEDVAAKAPVVAGVTFAAIKIEMKSFEYIDVYKRNAELADSLGDSARDLRNIQRMRDRYVQEYHVEKRKLEEMMRP
jgi:hypothetical protein